jgi:hypothetical protein
MSRARFVRTASLALATLACALTACERRPKEGGDDAAPVSISSAREIVPPAAPFNATPVSEFADAGNLDTQSPFEQAKVFYAQGQLWMGRLVLERKALGTDATKEETELLVKICQDQGDAPCVEACARKLGRKIKMPDGGAPPATASASASAREHKEPDNELARARDLVLKMQYEPARKTLEPKVLDGKASREEIRMLRTVCEKQGDRMCVALCDSKLK